MKHWQIFPNQARFGKMISRQSKTVTRTVKTHTLLYTQFCHINETANEMHRNESAVARSKGQKGLNVVQHFWDLKQGRYCRCPLTHRRLSDERILYLCLHFSLASFPPSLIKNRGGGRAPTSCMSSGFYVRDIWLLGLHTSAHVRASLSQTSAPNSMTPVSIMGTILSSTWTSRMVLSIWERLLRSRLQGTHRWITCRWRQRGKCVTGRVMRPKFRISQSQMHRINWKAGQSVGDELQTKIAQNGWMK